MMKASYLARGEGEGGGINLLRIWYFGGKVVFEVSLF